MGATRPTQRRLLLCCMPYAACVTLPLFLRPKHLLAMTLACSLSTDRRKDSDTVKWRPLLLSPFPPSCRQINIDAELSRGNGCPSNLICG